MDFYYLTDIGKKRKTNQDTVAGNIISENLAWSIVCDGMGGNNGGDIASSMATRGISELINRNLDILNNYKLPDRQTVYEEWAWATFYTTRAGDVITTNTFITSQKDDIMGTFGLTSTGTVKNIYGNATTIIFSHVNISYNNLIPEKTPDEEPSNNNGS